MTIEIKVPDLPESVPDAIIAAWSVKVGDYVEKEQNILELETDKVVLEVPSPVSGFIEELKVSEGDVVLGGDIIGVIKEGEAPADSGSDDNEAAEDTTCLDCVPN